MWQLVDSVSALLSLVLAGMAVVFAGAAWRKSRQTQRHSLLNSYFREYRSPEMGKAVQAIWDVFHCECDNSRRRLIEYYVREYRRGSPFHIETRRFVSAFYQEIAILVQDDPELRQIVYSVWKKGDLQIIPDILLPIERIAIPVAKRDIDMPGPADALAIKRNTLPSVFRAMYDLYARAPDQ